MTLIGTWFMGFYAGDGGWQPGKDYGFFRFPTLDPGAIVSVSRNLTDLVVTEYGVAKLRQRTVRQRVENLIAVAHPDFRAELRRQANRLLYF